MKRFLLAFEAQRSGAILFEMFLLMLIVGWVDWITGYEVSFFLFYAIPIFVVAWYCDSRSALLMALLSGITWWWADRATGHRYDYTWLEAWETSVRLGFFLISAVGSSALRAKRDMAIARIALLEHSQRLEREIVGIAEREKQRIGQDLHDDLCQFLAGIGCAAASLETDLTRRELPEEAVAAGELASLLEQAILQTRNLARGLVPVHMDSAGILSALEELADSVTRLRNVECSFSHSDEVPELPPETAVHLFRIAQEAVNNALRHGLATRIEISIRTTAGRVGMRVSDDGRGLPVTRASGGMGLKIMEYRSRLCGGSLEIKPGAAGGTTVVCSIPVLSILPHQHAA